jgi:hypothetical protein
MRTTIIPGRNLVIMNGQNTEIDCSSIPSNYKRIEWFGEHGTIEMVDGTVAEFKDTAGPIREVMTDALCRLGFAQVVRRAKGEPEPGGKA